MSPEKKKLPNIIGTIEIVEIEKANKNTIHRIGYARRCQHSGANTFGHDKTRRVNPTANCEIHNSIR